MAEFIGSEEKVIEADESVTFENITDSDFEVSTGIIFHKSGLYNVSIVGRRTIISKVAEQKRGKWITNLYAFGEDRYGCDQCRHTALHCYDFCPNCGADMRGE